MQTSSLLNGKSLQHQQTIKRYLSEQNKICEKQNSHNWDKNQKHHQS